MHTYTRCSMHACTYMIPFIGRNATSSMWISVFDLSWCFHAPVFMHPGSDVVPAVVVHSHALFALLLASYQSLPSCCVVSPLKLEIANSSCCVTSWICKKVDLSWKVGKIFLPVVACCLDSFLWILFCLNWLKTKTIRPIWEPHFHSSVGHCHICQSKVFPCSICERFAVHGRFPCI